MAAQSIDIKIVNDEKLQKLFSELTPNIQTKIVVDGYKIAGKIIGAEAKQNLKSRTNIKKVSGVNGIKVQKMAKNRLGVKVGFQNYKLRWLEWGTDKREYFKGQSRATQRTRREMGGQDGGHNTGKIKSRNFFYDAVKAKNKVANDTIEKSIVQSFDKVIKKYN